MHRVLRRLYVRGSYVCSSGTHRGLRPCKLCIDEKPSSAASASFRFTSRAADCAAQPPTAPRGRAKCQAAADGKRGQSPTQHTTPVPGHRQRHLQVTQAIWDEDVNGSVDEDYETLAKLGAAQVGRQTNPYTISKEREHT